MTGRPVLIESADPSTGEPVAAHVDQASGSWDPAEITDGIVSQNRALQAGIGIFGQLLS